MSSPIASLLGMVASHPLRVFPPGSILLAEGRRTGVLFVLEAGTVEILREDVQLACVSQPGAVFGEVNVLLDHPHIATVRVRSESRFRVIADPVPFLRAHPDAALHVALVLAQRLASVTSYLVELKREREDRLGYLARADEMLARLLHPHTRTGAGPDGVGGPGRSGSNPGLGGGATGASSRPNPG